MAPWNIAHRGGAGLMPENTLAAFSNAVALGCDGIELDVQLSRDGHVVVYHDYRLTPQLCRGPDGKWLAGHTPRLKDLTLAELGRYDIGRADPASAYALRHPHTAWRDGERIPTLAAAIAVAKTSPKPFHLFVELKTSFADRELSAAPQVLADAALAAVKEADYLGRTIFVGFDWPALLQVKRTAPDAQCWFTTMAQSWFRPGTPPAADDPPPPPALQVFREWARTGTSPWAGGYDAVHFGGSILQAIRAAGGDGWFAPLGDATRAAIAEAHDLGLKAGAWTAATATETQMLAAHGVEAVCTDRPDLFSTNETIR